METKIKEFILEHLPILKAAEYGVYPKSVHIDGDSIVFMADYGDRDVLMSAGNTVFTGKKQEIEGCVWTESELTHKNAELLRKKYPFTAPVPVLRHPRSVGTGDRLGIATPGHIRVFEKYDAYPVFAQQSVRELNLTGRTFEDVLDCASWSVFRENFTRGFGADGDHLKTPEEVREAIKTGYTMITLDCSEHIRGDIAAMTDEEVNKEYRADPELEERYLGKSFQVEQYDITFDTAEFRRMCLIYNDAIDFAVMIYKKFFTGLEEKADFEISIDETETATLASQHFYVANELIRRGVKPATIAPRFCGEFQKGIDYIGNLDQFQKEFAEHAAIARYFGYKISVHSGSDKFSVFEAVGKETKGKFHLKTAGTNWLEAMKVVAEREPALYREIHQFAVEKAFEEARKYYHVTTDLENIPDLDTLEDVQLPELFDNPNSRQLIHITYGLILNAENPDGSLRFKDKLFQVWRRFRTEYAQNLETHIGRHLELLYRGFKEEEP